MFWLPDPSSFGAGSQRSQPKHVLNLDFVIKKFKPHLIYNGLLSGQALGTGWLAN